ncbi:uncharacterized protein LOC128237783 [Mya arenaria]|uniref:uncharacterized protein LOC128237783 n=1 Tax=Mya arenaria TaxID=6604 RepID=UPI0022E82679|nr:uncharacterized protein LOC128237783 [Mya arenaria]
MFKFSKRKTSSSDIVNEDNEQSPVNDLVTDKPSNGESIKIPNGVSEENAGGIRRLDSLDSGIVVEKVNVNQRVSVEYAFPQKRKQDTGNEPSNDNHTERSQLELVVEAGAEHGSDIVGQRLAEPIYINGEKEDEDFVYINERAVDVADLSKSQCSIVAAVNAGPSGIAYDQVEKDNREDADDEKESDISSDSGTGMASKVKMVDKPSKPNIVKLKKKSWSFQFGKKKTSENNEETKSNGSTEAEKETKKPRWKFGKFSFRRPQEVSASTPDLTNACIPEEAPEEQETMDKKPRKLSRLRQLISKKSRKKSAASSDDGLERRSMSMMDISIPDNTARSRRSIVEKEIHLPQTDAFDGVELSDLSQEEDGADDQNKKRREKKSKLAKSKHSVKDTGKPSHEAGEAKDNNNEADGITDSIQDGQVYVNQTVEVSGVNEAPVIEDEYANMVEQPSSPTKKQINITLQMPKVPVIEDHNKTDRPVDDSQANVEAEPDYAVLKEDTVEENQVIIDTPVQNIIIEPPEDFVDPNEEVQETFVKQEAKRKELAYSNLLYASTDFNSPAEPSNDTSAMESPDEDESDAFVQLQEIVNDQTEPDMSEITETFHVKNDDQRRQNRESFVSNMAEMFEPVKIAADNSLAQSCNSSEGLTNKVETKIVLMREIGVQAPDIYMPLDKEDFGFTDKKVTTCDIGVQVNTFENTVEDKVVTPKLVQETNETVSTDKDDSTAFF